MTEIDKLQQELSKAKISYQEALQNSRTKAGFLGRIAHEIRSPLSSLMGLHQLIINDLCENPQEEREFIQEAYQYAKKLVTMIDQLIEVSKLEVGKIDLETQLFNLSELLEDIYAAINLEVENKNLKLKLENQQEDLMINTDRVKLTNILFFLLEVVIDSSEMGIITLNVSQDQNTQQPLIEITFPCDNFKLQKLDENIDLIETPIEELTRLHGLPQFSNDMKIILVETLLEIMGGNLQSNTLTKNDDSLTQLKLSLPSETV